MRAGDVDVAADLFTAAIVGRSEPWTSVTTDPSAYPSAEPAWLYGLGLSVRRKDPAGAANVVAAACERAPGKTRWMAALADSYVAAGLHAKAAVVLERLVSQLEGNDPRPTLQLAALCHRAGEWARAERLLLDNLDRHPEHAGFFKQLAEASSAIARWGGTFSDSLASRADATFSRREPASDPVDARKHAVQLQPARPTWRALLADEQARTGAHTDAIGNYETVLADARASADRWALGVKQRWQFSLERLYAAGGRQRVDDPLFACDARSAGAQVDVRSPAGFFDVRFTDMGMVVEGFVATEPTDRVDVLLDGRLLRALTPGASYLPQFTLLVRRKTLAQFPRQAGLEVRTAAGTLLLGRGGYERFDLETPHGDGSLLKGLDDGRTLTKKGAVQPSEEDIRDRHLGDLEVYSRARDFFADELGRPLFLLYGTLLGCVRNGEFVPGDDDFDVGYVSDQTTPEAVKDEAIEIIVELVKAGFTVSFNRRGRLFRVHLDTRATSDRHLDVQFVWLQDGYAWAHNQARIPASRDDFLPVGQHTLAGTTVAVPHRPEVFLAGNYGPRWRTPDPTFRYYPADVDRKVRDNLARTLMSVREYKQLAAEVVKETKGVDGAGRLVSLGSQDLYPLDQFIS